MKDSEPDPDHIFLEVDYSNLIGVRVLPVNSDQSQSSVRTRDNDRALLELTIKPVSKILILTLNMLIFLVHYIEANWELQLYERFGLEYS